MVRRLAAIVAADVANYGTLIAQDESGTLKEFNRLHDEIITPAIKKYKGQIIRLIGDGSLLAFDSALNSVKFAVDVQRSISSSKTSPKTDAPIKLRMGANLGDVVRQRNDIHGEGINVAVRLEELAPPGGLCISHTLYMQTKNALGEELLPIGERHLKHIAEPVLVWRWQPNDGANTAIQTGAPHRSRDSYGRHILDPKVTSLLVDLHLRSARLALSNAFDTLLASPDGGRHLSLEDIHETISHELDDAVEMLFPVSVERAPLPAAARRRQRSALALGDHLANEFDNGDMFFALNMLKQIRSILRLRTSDERQKRQQLMRLAAEIMHERKTPQIKDSIRFAYVEP